MGRTEPAGPAKWSYFHLYVITEIYPRYVVGRFPADREGSVPVEKFLADTITEQHIDRNTLTLHADNGTSTASKPVAFPLTDLGVTKSHSRPRTPNDDPYSEAHFKALKYRPDFPDRFDTGERVRAFCRTFFTWYNTAHRHSGTTRRTPHDVHHGHTDAVNAVRPGVPAAVYRHRPEPAAPPATARITPPSRDQQEH